MRRDDWETPPELFGNLNREFQFTLDAAASDANAKCSRYYTIAEDGLSMPWAGHRVWCNPPYGRDVSAWVAKAAGEHAVSGTTVVLLLPARVDTAWFHDLVMPQAQLRFIRGRVYFHVDGEAVDRAPFPSLLAIYQGAP